MTRLMLWVAGLLFSMQAVCQQQNHTVQSYFDQPNNIRCYLSKHASKITQNALRDIHNLQDWQSQRDERWQQLVEMLGLQARPLQQQRNAPKVIYTGEIQQEGFTIKKLYYESMPGLYVPANLYIPDNMKKPAPAILYVCGHAHTQKHHYQSHARALARHGFVCLIIETIQRGEVKGEHLGAESLGWFHWYSKGYNPAGVEVWNGMRGLDLLSQLKEVDANRMGVTGISGGGSQSWYLPAIDSRIKAAAAVAGAGSLEGQIVQRTVDDHCDCMMPVNTYGVDFSDIGALIAPRAFMIAQPTSDLYYSIEAVRTLHQKIKPVYGFYKKEEKLRMEEAPGGHSYGSGEELRSVILSFFMQELMDKKITPEAIGTLETDKPLSNEQLKAYEEGAPQGDLTKTIQDVFVPLANPEVLASKEAFLTYKNNTIAQLKKKTFRAFPSEAPPLDVKKEFAYANKRGDRGEVYSFVPEEGWRLKLTLSKGQPSQEQKPVVLVLKNPVEGRWDSYALTSGVAPNAMIARFEARGIGETGWSPALQWHVRRAAAWTGRTVASMRVYDVLRCLAVLRQLPGVDPTQVSILAEGEMAAIAAYAALLDGKVKSLLLKNPPATQDAPGNPDGTGQALEMLNSLQIVDLPQVAALVYPASLVAVGNWPESYRWTADTYSNLGIPFLQVEKAKEWFEK